MPGQARKAHSAGMATPTNETKTRNPWLHRAAAGLAVATAVAPPVVLGAHPLFARIALNHNETAAQDDRD